MLSHLLYHLIDELQREPTHEAQRAPLERDQRRNCTQKLFSCVEDSPIAADRHDVADHSLMRLRHENVGSVLGMKFGHFLMGASIDEIELRLAVLHECLSNFLH